MEECSVLIIANEIMNPDLMIGVYQKDFNHFESTHAAIYKKFCHQYFKELEKLISDDMIGADCANLFSRLGFLSYIRYANILELYIPVVETLSPLQKAWIKESYHALSEEYEMDISILVKKEHYIRMKQYESSTVKLGVIEELKEIVKEKEMDYLENQRK